MMFNANAQPIIQLIRALPDQAFPSASSIEYYQGCLYVVGDDAAYILVTDTQFRTLKKLSVTGEDDGRIAKKQKADYEASVAFTFNQEPYLLVIGSGSKPLRRRCLLVNLITSTITPILNPLPYESLERQGFTDLNLESAAMLGNKLLLGSRGHKKRPGNILALMNADDFIQNRPLRPEIKTLKLGGHTTLPAGLSGLCYVPEKDILLFTASVEDTENSYDDGEIGESFIGGISGMKEKLNQATWTPDFLIPASSLSPEIQGEKLEGIAAMDNGSQLHLFVVSDDDNGHSGLFELLLTLPAQPSLYP